MERLLILSSKKSKWLCKIADRINVDNSFEVEVFTYKDIKIVLGELTEIYINNKSLKEYSHIITRFEKRSNGLANIIGIYAEHNNLTFFNSYLSTLSFGNKLIQYSLLALNNVRIPKSYYIDRSKIEENIQEIETHFSYPLIMKDIDGMKGKNNFLISKKEDILNVIKLSSNDINFIFQEYIPNSFDYRVLVLNKSKVICIDQRARKDKIAEHRNNAALGGIETFFDPKTFNDEALITLAVKVASTCKLEVAGIDIIKSEKDNWFYVIEANSSPGITLNSFEETAFIEGIRELSNLS